MEDMNVIEMVAENTATMEAPVCEAACGTTDTKANILGTIVATGTVIVLWEGGKRIVKKIVTGIKDGIAKRKAAKAEVVEEVDIEVENVD